MLYDVQEESIQQEIVNKRRSRKKARVKLQRTLVYIRVYLGCVLATAGTEDTYIEQFSD